MMNARLNKALVALLAVSAGACGDAPVDVAQNDPDRLVTNPSFVVIEAGETRLVQAYLVNALGNPVAGDVDFEPCNAAITVEQDPDQTDLEPGNNFLITGNTLGTSCVNVSGSGEEATVNVRIIPAELALSLQDTVLSGASATAGVTFLNAGGTAATGFDLDEVSFSSLDTLIAVVDPVTGDVTARAPGTARVVVSLDAGLGAARADTFSVVVVPASFAGTTTPDEGPGGQRVTFEWNGTQPEWDSNSSALIRFGFEDYPLYRLLGSDANTFITDIPMGAAITGTGTVTFSGLGPTQIALSTTFDVTSVSTNDEHEPNQTFATGTPITLPYDNVLFQDGTDTEDRFLIPASATTRNVTFTLDWDDEHGSHDLDLLVYQQSGAAFANIAACNAATAAHPETVTCNLPANVVIGVRVQNYDATEHGNNGPTNYRLRIIQN